MSQNNQVLALLKDGKHITQRSILRLGIYRLASRVNELREKGWPIMTTLHPNKCSRYASYHLDLRKSRWPKSSL